MSKLLDILYGSYKSLNGSKLIAGLAMIIVNIFSKYVVIDLSKSQEAFIRNAVTREILIFIMIFANTGDILLSIIVTAAFVILSNTIFHEKSRFCVLPEKYVKLRDLIDTNKDGYISDAEIENAKDILYKASIQDNKAMQLKNINYFQSNI